MLIAVVVCLVGAATLTWLGERRDWAPVQAVVGTVRDGWPWVVAYVSSAPATFIYLFVLLVTSWVLHSANPRVEQVLLATHSTNLANLRDHPLDVLVTSAFYMESLHVLWWTALFAGVMAPVERWLGSLRFITVFAIGHVMATLATAVALDHHLFGLAGDVSPRAIDVGVSYGFFCVAAVFTYRLPGWWRWLWAVVVLAWAAVPYAVEPDFTGFGHLTSVLIGFLLIGFVSTSATRARALLPIWRPTERAVAAARASIAARREGRRPTVVIVPVEPVDDAPGPGAEPIPGVDPAPPKPME